MNNAPRMPDRKADDADNIAPGQYEPKGIQPFTKDTKGGKMGKPKTNSSPTSGQGGGPGTYDADKADALTKPKPRAAHISNAPRADNFKGDDGDGGPGTYNAGDSFGNGVPTFTFPPSPKKAAPQISAGPGEYDTGRADSVTKGRPQACNFSQ